MFFSPLSLPHAGQHGKKRIQGAHFFQLLQLIPEVIQGESRLAIFLASSLAFSWSKASSGLFHQG
jgi:hypothetical protein